MPDIPDYKSLPGYKRRDVLPCSSCQKGVMHDQLMTFFVLDLRYCMADLQAMQREHGLEQLVGGHVPLATALSPDPDLAKVLTDHKIWLCLECATTKPLAQIWEKLTDAGDDDNGDGE